MNITGSKYEAYVDRRMDSISKRAQALADYVKTAPGRDRLLMIEKVAALVSALLLGLSNPTIVLLTATIGIAVRAFSPEQLKSLDASIAIVWEAMPFRVNALAIVVKCFMHLRFILCGQGFQSEKCWEHMFLHRKL